ncbi:hypothetical protein L484_005740 [Morus notabilis]|uniref:Uncharacterized protein n=1 Tax=Morus notabilis TaxID=981085 RepID=W9RM89_9ROSA|nr:hypothetical protein L484_005740 [Morus notabilis]
MKMQITVLLALASVIVLVNIHSIEAGRVLKENQNLVSNDRLLLSALPKGSNPPSSGNPTKPSSIDDRAFAGHAMPPPPAETEPQGSLSRSS